jgi:hypothetical protein
MHLCACRHKGSAGGGLGAIDLGRVSSQPRHKNSVTSLHLQTVKIAK